MNAVQRSGLTFLLTGIMFAIFSANPGAEDLRVFFGLVAVIVFMLGGLIFNVFNGSERRE